MYYMDLHDVYTDEQKLKFFDMLIAEADTVRETDKILIRSIFKNFNKKKVALGIGFQRAFGSVLSGDYFDLIKLPDGNFLFIFADISGHGLPAYTSLIRLRSAITISFKELERIYKKNKILDTDIFIKDIVIRFTDIMEEANSDDFACVNFTFIINQEDSFLLKFYNRSMLYPIIVRNQGDEDISIINLNFPHDDWTPRKGHLLGKDLCAILGDIYYKTPSCSFLLEERDSILYFSDGIIEAYKQDNPNEEFHYSGVEKILRECHDLPPQLTINYMFELIYDFIGHPSNQKDDMTAVLIDFLTASY